MKRQLLATLLALFATSSLASKWQRGLDFCKDEKAVCEQTCSTRGGFLYDLGGKINEVTNKHHKGGNKGYICLPHISIKKCQDNTDCKNNGICSDVFGLLKKEERICLPSAIASVKR